MAKEWHNIQMNEMFLNRNAHQSRVLFSLQQHTSIWHSLYKFKLTQLKVPWVWTPATGKIRSTGKAVVKFPTVAAVTIGLQVIFVERLRVWKMLTSARRFENHFRSFAGQMCRWRGVSLGLKVYAKNAARIQIKHFFVVGPTQEFGTHWWLAVVWNRILKNNICSMI